MAIIVLYCDTARPGEPAGALPGWKAGARMGTCGSGLGWKGPLNVWLVMNGCCRACLGDQRVLGSKSCPEIIGF